MRAKELKGNSFGAKALVVLVFEGFPYEEFFYSPFIIEMNKDLD